jgi:hypothetical protein
MLILLEVFLESIATSLMDSFEYRDHPTRYPTGQAVVRYLVYQRGVNKRLGERSPRVANFMKLANSGIAGILRRNTLMSRTYGSSRLSSPGCFRLERNAQTKMIDSDLICHIPYEGRVALPPRYA